jgi:D-cysteine desulfhydrase
MRAPDLPRRALAVLPTPLHRLPALERLLGRGPLYLKRDDLTGFGVAGNKARALEFLLGDALARQADVLVTAGAPSSNFVAAAALAARVCGLDSEVLVAGSDPPQLPVNLALARRAGATLRFTGAHRDQLDRLVDEHVPKLRAVGREPYPVPRGGATAVGALGFARAAEELAGQLDDDSASVVLPTGSGASLAGFLAGRAAIGAGWRLYGISVSRPASRIWAEILGLAAACATLTGTPAPAGHDVTVVDAVGEGFGRRADRDLDNILAVLWREGVVFDPTYGAKMLGALFEPRLPAGPVVLWHTGGLPAALALLADAAS